MSEPLRIMIYDDTCRGDSGPIGLTHSWIAGALLYGAMGRFDASRGFSCWADALAWIAEFEPDREVGEIQFWGHGKWGRAMIDRDRLDVSALEPGSPLHAPLSRIRERMTPDSLWWFRTCETFGAKLGHDFARAWTDFFGCSAAGHTYIIGPWQSGLHRLKPGATIDWELSEGLQAGTPDAPQKSLWSKFRAPNTISCLRGDVPIWAASETYRSS